MSAPDRERRAEALVRALCSEACRGRKPGSPGSAAARAQILEAFEAAGLEPAGEDGFLQTVPGCGVNLLARRPGRGPLADRAILVAAHYDHLGEGPGGECYWGADDNAAALAILIDVARALSSEALGRQVIFAAFDGEEPPHFLTQTMGSMHYTRQPTVPLERIDMMLCMDLVGHALGPPQFPPLVRDSLFVLGAELSQGTPALVDAVARRATGVVPRRLGLDVIPPLSDYYAFHQEGVPVLFLTCGRWEHYHQPSDTPEKLDYPKIVASAEFLRELVESLSTRPESPVVFERDGRDDAASLRSLAEMGALLAPHVPQVAGLLPILEPLRAKAEQGPLDAREQSLIATLVAGLESVLG